MHTPSRTVLVCAVAVSLMATTVITASVNAQSASTGSAATAAPAQARDADPADVASVDAIVRALYESISGPKGAPRDWARLRTLYGPNARMIYTTVGADGKGRLINWNVEEYIAAAGPGLMANGFYEREIGRRTESFGNVTAIMSAYDSKFTLEDATPFQRGVNSIQLFYSGTRWYILSVMWDSERAGNPIPAKYLAPR
ncbi:MAG: hypothetical protein IT357_07640 [Gemmatimonadaceae bacterium]|nr:hypothetical protein [Gemmatimonadaceae bacterium]